MMGDKATHVIGTPIVMASVNTGRTVLKYPFVYGTPYPPKLAICDIHSNGSNFLLNV